MRVGRPGRVLALGAAPAIAGTVYGTIVAMATIAAGSRGADTEPWGLAVAVGVTVLVLWLAHVYSHALGDSLKRGRRIDRAELGDITRREWAIPAAAVAPIAALVLAGLDVLAVRTALWVALGIGVATLAAVGLQLSRLERLGWVGTCTVVGLNVALGFAIVALEVLLTH
jgi:hypothetical protein